MVTGGQVVTRWAGGDQVGLVVTGGWLGGSWGWGATASGCRGSSALRACGCPRPAQAACPKGVCLTALIGNTVPMTTALLRPGGIATTYGRDGRHYGDLVLAMAALRITFASIPPCAPLPGFALTEVWLRCGAYPHRLKRPMGPSPLAPPTPAIDRMA